MYHSTLEDIEGRKFKVIDVVFSFCRVYSDDSEGHDKESLISEMDKQAVSLGADGIIGITYKCVSTWTKECFDGYARYYDRELDTWFEMDPLEFDNPIYHHYHREKRGRPYSVEVQDMFAYGTAIKFEE